MRLYNFKYKDHVPALSRQWWTRKGLMLVIILVIALFAFSSGLREVVLGKLSSGLDTVVAVSSNLVVDSGRFLMHQFGLEKKGVDLETGHPSRFLDHRQLVDMWLRWGGGVGVLLPGLLVLGVLALLRLRETFQSIPPLDEQNLTQFKLVCHRLGQAQWRNLIFDAERVWATVIAIGLSLFLFQLGLQHYFQLSSQFVLGFVLIFIGYSYIVHTQFLIHYKGIYREVIWAIEANLCLKHGLMTLLGVKPSQAISRLYSFLLADMSQRLEKLNISALFPHRFPQLTKHNFGFPLVVLATLAFFVTMAIPQLTSLINGQQDSVPQPVASSVTELDEIIKQEAEKLKLLSDELVSNRKLQGINYVVPELKELSNDLVALSEMDLGVDVSDEMYAYNLFPKTLPNDSSASDYKQQVVYDDKPLEASLTEGVSQGVENKNRIIAQQQRDRVSPGAYLSGEEQLPGVRPLVIEDGNYLSFEGVASELSRLSQELMNAGSLNTRNNNQPLQSPPGKEGTLEQPAHISAEDILLAAQYLEQRTTTDASLENNLLQSVAPPLSTSQQANRSVVELSQQQVEALLNSNQQVTEIGEESRTALRQASSELAQLAERLMNLETDQTSLGQQRERQLALESGSQRRNAAQPTRSTQEGTNQQTADTSPANVSRQNQQVTTFYNPRNVMVSPQKPLGELPAEFADWSLNEVQAGQVQPPLSTDELGEQVRVNALRLELLGETLLLVANPQDVALDTNASKYIAPKLGKSLLAVTDPELIQNNIPELTTVLQDVRDPRNIDIITSQLNRLGQEFDNWQMDNLFAGIQPLSDRQAPENFREQVDRDFVQNGGSSQASREAITVRGEQLSDPLSMSNRDLERIRLEESPQHLPLHNRISNISLDLERIGSELINWDVQRRESILEGADMAGNSLIPVESLARESGLPDLINSGRNRLQALANQLPQAGNPQDIEQITGQMAELAQQVGNLSLETANSLQLADNAPDGSAIPQDSRLPGDQQLALQELINDGNRLQALADQLPQADNPQDVEQITGQMAELAQRMGGLSLETANSLQLADNAPDGSAVPQSGDAAQLPGTRLSNGNQPVVQQLQQNGELLLELGTRLRPGLAPQVIESISSDILIAFNQLEGLTDTNGSASTDQGQELETSPSPLAQQGQQLQGLVQELRNQPNADDLSRYSYLVAQMANELRNLTPEQNDSQPPNAPDLEQMVRELEQVALQLRQQQELAESSQLAQLSRENLMPRPGLVSGDSPRTRPQSIAELGSIYTRWGNYDLGRLDTPLNQRVTTNIREALRDIEDRLRQLKDRVETQGNTQELEELGMELVSLSQSLTTNLLPTSSSMVRGEMLSPDTEANMAQQVEQQAQVLETLSQRMQAVSRPDELRQLATDLSGVHQQLAQLREGGSPQMESRLTEAVQLIDQLNGELNRLSDLQQQTPQDLSLAQMQQLGSQLENLSRQLPSSVQLGDRQDMAWNLMNISQQLQHLRQPLDNQLNPSGLTNGDQSAQYFQQVISENEERLRQLVERMRTNTDGRHLNQIGLELAQLASEMSALELSQMMPSEQAMRDFNSVAQELGHLSQEILNGDRAQNYTLSDDMVDRTVQRAIDQRIESLRRLNQGLTEEGNLNQAAELAHEVDTLAEELRRQTSFPQQVLDQQAGTDSLTGDSSPLDGMVDALTRISHQLNASQQVSDFRRTGADLDELLQELGNLITGATRISSSNTQVLEDQLEDLVVDPELVADLARLYGELRRLNLSHGELANSRIIEEAEQLEVQSNLLIEVFQTNRIASRLNELAIQLLGVNSASDDYQYQLDNGGQAYEAGDVSQQFGDAQADDRSLYQQTPAEIKRQQALNRLNQAIRQLRQHQYELDELYNPGQRSRRLAVADREGDQLSREDNRRGAKTHLGQGGVSNTNVAREISITPESEAINNAYSMEENLYQQETLARIIKRIENHKKRIGQTSSPSRRARQLPTYEAYQQEGQLPQPQGLEVNRLDLTPQEMANLPKRGSVPQPEITPVTERPVSYEDQSAKLKTGFAELPIKINKPSELKEVDDIPFDKTSPQQKVIKGLRLNPEQAADESVPYQPIPQHYKEIIQKIFLNT